MRAITIIWFLFITLLLLLTKLVGEFDSLYSSNITLKVMWIAQVLFWLATIPLLPQSKKITSELLYICAYIITGSAFSIAIFSRIHPINSQEVILFIPTLLIMFLFCHELNKLCSKHYYLLLTIIYVCPQLIKWFSSQLVKSKFATSPSYDFLDITNPLRIYSGQWVIFIYIAVAIISLLAPYVQQSERPHA